MSLESHARLTTEDVRGNDLIWLLDLYFAGRLFRVSSEPVDAPTGDEGADVRYHQGFDPLDTITDELALFSDTPNQKSADIAVHLPPGVSVSNLVSEGHDLGATRAQLHLWARGADRFVTVIDGVAEGVSWYDDDSPLTFTLTEAPINDTSEWPPLWAKVDTTTWATPDPIIIGEYYPTVIGTPGRAASASLQPDGTPALFVNITGGSEELLISDGDIIGTGATQTITIYNASDGTSESFAVTGPTTDGRNRTVTTVDISGATTLTIQPGDEYWTAWSGTTHGIVGDDKSSALTQAGDVLIWMLRKTRIRWDRGRLAAASQYLNKFKIDTYIQADPDERIKPWDWIQSNLLDILPVSARIGPNGLYFVVWDYFARSDAAVASLEWGRNADRDGAVDIEGPQTPASTVTLRYQWAASRRTFEDYDGRSDDAVLRGKDSKYSQDLYTARAGASYVSIGYRESLNPEAADFEGSTEVVREAFTAGLILAWWARRESQTVLVCDYLVDKEDAAVLYPGNVVTITDSGRGFADRVCLVSAIALSVDGKMRTTLRIPPVDLGEAG